MSQPGRNPRERFTRGRFDMIATFAEERQARAALAELRDAGFGPEEALLLRPEQPSSLDGLAHDDYTKFSPDELVTDAVIARWIIVGVEFTVGALGGAVVGWLIALFLNAPQIGPVWFWMLSLSAVGAIGGILLGSLEWKRWRREIEAIRQQTAIGMRFSGRNPAAAVARARAILEQHGGAGIDNA